MKSMPMPNRKAPTTSETFKGGWNCSNGSTIRPTEWPGNRMLAIGMPEARPFGAAAKHDGGIVPLAEPSDMAAPCGGEQHGPQQRQVEGSNLRDRDGVHLMPNARNHPGAERGINY